MRYNPSATFPDAAQEASLWVRELSELLGCDQGVAYEVLRTTMHLIRDRMSVAENAKVANSLPSALRGLYFEAWDPKSDQETDHLEDLPVLLRSALPRIVSSTPDLFPKIERLFAERGHHKRATKLDLALMHCAHAV